MKHLHKTFTALAVATTTVLSLSASVSAATLNFGLSFTTNNQSIWDTGNALNVNHDRFLGLQWDKSTGAGFTIPVPIPFVDDIDVGFNAFTNGEIGIKSTLNLDGGTVSAFIPVDLFLTLPEQPIKPGETVTLQSGFSFGNNASFTTSSPRASYALDLLFRMVAGIDVNPGNTLDYNWGLDASETLFSFGSDYLNFQAGVNLASIEVHFPEVDTVGTLAGSNQVISSGEDKFINGTLDLDKVVTTLYPAVPPFEGGGSIPLPFGVGNLGFNYNLLDATATTSLALLQNFLLTGTLPGIFNLEDGSTIPFKVGDNITFTVPTNVDDFLEINALVNLNALFSNTTSLGLDIGLEVLAGQFGLDIPFFGSQSFGPLYQDRIGLLNPSFELYKRTFNLAGFNQQSFGFQIPVALGTGTGGTGGDGSAKVPEPSNIVALLGVALVGFRLLRHRRIPEKS